MSTISVTNVKHESSTPNNIVLTSDGDIQIARALGLGGATYGTSGQVLTSAGSGAVPTWEDAANSAALAADVASTSGSTVDFTGLPSWVTAIDVMLHNVSFAGTSELGIRLGDGTTFYDTGYDSASVNQAGSASSFSTTSFVMDGSGATTEHFGIFRLVQMRNDDGTDGDLWACHHMLKVSDGAGQRHGAGTLSLATGSAVTSVRVICLSDSFDQGVISLRYS